MIWLPLFPGIVALALLSSGMAVWAWPVVAVAVVALGVSLLGRWPAAGTLFCACVVGLALAQRDDAVWLYAAVGLMIVLYLVLLDARESLGALAELAGLTPWLTVEVVAVVVGQAVIALALVTPTRGGPAIVVVSGGSAAMLFWWLAQAASRRTGPDRPATGKGRGL